MICPQCGRPYFPFPSSSDVTLTQPSGTAFDMTTSTAFQRQRYYCCCSRWNAQGSIGDATINTPPPLADATSDDNARADSAQWIHELPAPEPHVEAVLYKMFFGKTQPSRDAHAPLTWSEVEPQLDALMRSLQSPSPDEDGEGGLRA